MRRLRSPVRCLPWLVFHGWPLRARAPPSAVRGAIFTVI